MKTIKEFDYDLWAVEKNKTKKYFVRVKATGEVSEVSHEVMKVLLSEEKRMRRNKEKSIYNPTLSLDYINTESKDAESYWLVDALQDVQEQHLFNEFKREFINNLTAKQKEIYFKCIIGEYSVTEYAVKTGKSRQAVMKTILQIREKAKKFFT